MVSTHSRLKAAGTEYTRRVGCPVVSTHSRLKAAGNEPERAARESRVSTHSRLKAAGKFGDYAGLATQGFNTQPPEGGWIVRYCCFSKRCCFNTQPPEGGWTGNFWADCVGQVSTHSRLKAAGRRNRPDHRLFLCFNTQPPEGGWETIHNHALLPF